MNVDTSTDNDRVVLPQWLAFRQAVSQPELNTFEKPIVPLNIESAVKKFNAIVDHFNAEPNPYVGAELMGVAVVLEQRATANKLAEYVASQPYLGTVAHSHASQILKSDHEPLPNRYRLIGILKRQVRNFPYDAVVWVDQARLYTILGKFEQARKSMLSALHVAPTNRFVVRAAIRFFSHTGYWDDAYRCGKRAFDLNPDPLIYGPLLSVATRLDKLPSKTKAAANHALVSSNKLLHSETLEAFGTLEILNGAKQKSKKFFKRAWLEPSKAVVSHSQWVLREHLPALADEQKIDFSQSKEAISWLHQNTLNYEEAISTAHEWELEEPYSKAPMILSAMLNSSLDRFDAAIEIAERGLLANPGDDVLLNNLAYAQLRKGDWQSAEKTLGLVKNLVGNIDHVALTATYGLLLMTKGDIVGGEVYYTMATNFAKGKNSRKLSMGVLLHYTISLLDTTGKVDLELLRSITNAIADFGDAYLLATASMLVRRFNKAKFGTSVELKTAAEEFSTAVKREEIRYLSSVSENLFPPKIQDNPQPIISQ